MTNGLTNDFMIERMKGARLITENQAPHIIPVHKSPYVR
jgi:hypothetical protein